MDFSAFNKKSADSFAKQKNLLKKLSQGREVKCEVCLRPVRLVQTSENQARAQCNKGCTDILLDLYTE